MFERISSVAVIAAGTVAWVIALVILLAVNADSNKIWISLVGIGLGIFGLQYTIRRNRRERN